MVDFKVLVSSPSQVCRDFSRQMATTMYGDRMPGTAQRLAFRREARRWCQYGNLSVHTAEPAQFTIEPFLPANHLRLSLVNEWGLIRTEDRLDAGSVSYLFWTRTMGEGAGTGFARDHGSDAWYDPASGLVHGLMDAAIHSGWGSIEQPGVVTAWPLNSTFPQIGNVHVFRCDGAEAFRPVDCPVRPILRKLFPADAVDGRVQVSSGEDIAVGGDVKVSRSIDTEGKNSVGITFGLNMLRTTTVETQADLSLTHVRSNADTVFYRSTWWLPDVPAIQRWIAARHHAGSLAKATHLAATLNPHHEILWEIPLSGNENRPLPYHVVYEAGWNTCSNGTHCADHRRQTGLNLPTKGRVGWSDGIVINLPWD
ncbi:hypothetical protein [Luteibacter sp.]|uniref:hypothetical protein n=1 Tax=Luteibacter sp. TaxID=1886636 RepID=UPI0025C4DE88|nr:hypothetical protein [Luteibacter sp.]